MAHIAIISQRIAIAMKASYSRDGISNRQHNEPAGNHDVWHFHSHLFLGYNYDKLYENHAHKQFVEPFAYRLYAERLRTYLEANSDKAKSKL